MKKRLLSVILVIVTLFAVMGFIACDTAPKSDPQKLSAPVVTLNGNVASWEANANADKFEISTDGVLSYVENTFTQKTLTNGQTLKVRAVGDGTNYSTSDWSNSVTYIAQGTPGSPVQLQTPSVSVSNSGIASWNAIPNANGYKYKINGGSEQFTTALSLQLTNGQSIVVKPVGDGSSYTDSNWSEPVTYTAQGSNPPGGETTAPTYLGIKASVSTPTQSDAPTGQLLFFSCVI